MRFNCAKQESFSFADSEEAALDDDEVLPAESALCPRCGEKFERRYFVVCSDCLWVRIKQLGGLR